MSKQSPAAAFSVLVASYYAMPPEAPRGCVQLRTFGSRTSTPPAERTSSAQSTWASWSPRCRHDVEDRHARAAARDSRSRQSGPVFASSDAAPGPILETPPSGERAVDFFLSARSPVAFDPTPAPPATPPLVPVPTPVPLASPAPTSDPDSPIDPGRVSAGLQPAATASPTGTNCVTRDRKRPGFMA